jgi:hypothetical protein
MDVGMIDALRAQNDGCAFLQPEEICFPRRSIVEKCNALQHFLYSLQDLRLKIAKSMNGHDSILPEGDRDPIADKMRDGNHSSRDSEMFTNHFP